MRWESTDLKKGAVTLMLALGVAGCAVEPTPPTAIGFVAGPTTTTAGASLGPIKVQFLDESAQPLASGTGEVTIALTSPAGATLLGTKTATVVDGVATFSGLSITTAGTGYVLSATSGALPTITSAPFAITPGAASALAVLAAPTSVETGATPTPVVKIAVQDAFGNSVTTATTAIALTSTGGTPTLLGATTVSAVDGVATFTNLRFQGFGTVSLDATATGLTHIVTPQIGVTLTFASIAADTTHTCGLSTSGAAFCWGAQPVGELGTGGLSGNKTVPTPVSGGRLFSMIDLGANFTCALGATDFTMYCWGFNSSGQRGDGTISSTTTPAAVPGQLYASIAVGGSHTCGIQTTGPTQCWGNNGNAQVGDSTTTEKRVPTRVAGPQLTFTKVVGARFHTCGITSNSTYCWGTNITGQTGDGGASGNRLFPQLVSGGRIFTDIAAAGNSPAGGGHTCGVTSAGATWCWGGNVAGQLGDGTTIQRNQPVLVTGGISFTKISASPTQTCGLTSGGALYCWGLNMAGQTIVTPTRVGATSVTYTAVAVGHVHMCAIAAAGPGVANDGQAYCWGENLDGRLGIGSLVAAASPTAIIQR